MGKIVRIKLDDVEYVIPESVVANYPHLMLALQRQGSKEKPQTEIQTPFAGMGTTETQGSEETSEQASPRRNQRRGI